MIQGFLPDLGVAFMLTGAALLVTGTTSVIPFAMIAIGIALTVVYRRRHHATR